MAKDLFQPNDPADLVPPIKMPEGGGRRRASDIGLTKVGGRRGGGDDVLAMIDALPDPDGKAAVAEPTGERSWGEALADTGYNIGEGFANIAKTAGDVYGLTTGDMDNWLSKEGESAAKWWSAQRSAYIKAAERAHQARVDAQPDEFGKAVEAVKGTVTNPALAGQFFARQAPMLLPAAAGAMVGGVPGAIGIGALMQGADVGGDAYDEMMKLPTKVWETHPDYQALREAGKSDAQARNEIALDLARKAGTAGGVISLFAQKLPGGSTIERLMAGKLLAKRGIAGRVGGAAKGAFGEGASELTEEGGGALSKGVAVNQVDPSRDPFKGVGQAAGEGFLGGAGMGGVAGLFGREGEAADAPAPTAPGAAPAGPSGPTEPFLPPGPWDAPTARFVGRDPAAPDVTYTGRIGGPDRTPAGPPLDGPAGPAMLGTDQYGPRLRRPADWEVVDDGTEPPGGGGGPRLGTDPRDPQLPLSRDARPGPDWVADESGNVRRTTPESRMADAARGGDAARREAWLGGAVERMSADDERRRAQLGLTPDVRRAQENRSSTEPGDIQRGDVLFDGKRPWKFRSSAVAFAKKVGGEVVPVRGGFVIRPESADDFTALVNTPEIADELRAMAKEAGWDEIGGRMVRGRTDASGMESISRTKWIPKADWFAGMINRLPGNANGEATQRAVDKVFAGEKLTPAERRHVEEMLRRAQDNLRMYRGEVDEYGQPIEPRESSEDWSVDQQDETVTDPELAAEREAIQREAEALADEATDDELAALVEAVEAGDRRLSDDEIDAIFGTGSTATAGAEGEAAGARVEEPVAGGAGVRGPPSGQDAGADRQGADDFTLTGQTPEQVRQQEAERARRAADEKRREAAPPPDDFRLTGSDSAIDQARAAGQLELGEAPAAGPVTVVGEQRVQGEEGEGSFVRVQLSDGSTHDIYRGNAASDGVSGWHDRNETRLGHGYLGDTKQMAIDRLVERANAGDKPTPARPAPAAPKLTQREEERRVEVWRIRRVVADGYRKLGLEQQAAEIGEPRDDDHTVDGAQIQRWRSALAAAQKFDREGEKKPGIVARAERALAKKETPTDSAPKGSTNPEIAALEKRDAKARRAQEKTSDALRKARRAREKARGTPEAAAAEQAFKKADAANDAAYAEMMEAGRLLRAAQAAQAPTDSEGARPLYVSRPVVNAREIIDWARSQGFASTLKPGELHVTVAYSRDPVDTAKVAPDPTGQRSLLIDDGKRTVEKLGDEGAVVLKLESRTLQRRWQDHRDAGASWDWPSYQPHITITYDGAGVDLSKVEPFKGRIELGPEVADDLDLDAGDKVEETPTDSTPKGSPKAGKTPTDSAGWSNKHVSLPYAVSQILIAANDKYAAMTLQMVMRGEAKAELVTPDLQRNVMERGAKAVEDIKASFARDFAALKEGNVEPAMNMLAVFGANPVWARAIIQKLGATGGVQGRIAAWLRGAEGLYERGLFAEALDAFQRLASPSERKRAFDVAYSFPSEEKARAAFAKVAFVRADTPSMSAGEAAAIIAALQAEGIQKTGADAVVNGKPSDPQLPGAERLLLMPCSGPKAPGDLPASQKYTGSLWNVLRKQMPYGAGFGQGNKPVMHVLSAKFGVVPSDRPIPDYNVEMDKKIADRMIADGFDLEQFKGRTFRDVYITGGKEYRRVMRALVQQLQAAGIVAPDASINESAEGIGTKRGDLGDWLRLINTVDRRPATPDSARDPAVQQALSEKDVRSLRGRTTTDADLEYERNLMARFQFRAGTRLDVLRDADPGLMGGEELFVHTINPSVVWLSRTGGENLQIPLKQLEQLFESGAIQTRTATENRASAQALQDRVTGEVAGPPPKAATQPNDAWPFATRPSRPVTAGPVTQRAEAALSRDKAPEPAKDLKDGPRRKAAIFIRDELMKIPGVQLAANRRYADSRPWVLKFDNGARLDVSFTTTVGDGFIVYLTPAGQDTYSTQMKAREAKDTEPGRAAEALLRSWEFDSKGKPVPRGGEKPPTMGLPEDDAAPEPPLMRSPRGAAPAAAGAPRKARRGPAGMFQPIADAVGLKYRQARTTVLGMMTGLGGDQQFRAEKVGGIPQITEHLLERFARANHEPLDITQDDHRQALADMLAAEALAAIHSAGNAVQWYDETIASMLEMLSVKHPELRTDADARTAFLLATAISSQKQNVEDNLTFAEAQYAAFRKMGKFPERGTGEAAKSMQKNFRLANQLIKSLGVPGMRRFLATEFTAGELKAIGLEIDELVDEVVLGSAVFGPKIGFGFYSNLTGNFEPVTMDMWFMRTIGRLTGTLAEFDPARFAKQLDRFRGALDEKARKNGLYAAAFPPGLVKRARTSDAAAVQLARMVLSAHNREFANRRAEFDAGTRVKTDLVGAAQSIVKSMDKPKDAPDNGMERRLLRDVVRRMVDRVAQQYGQRVPPAALQALIWYPEQELWKALGAKLRVTSQDYAGAARKLLIGEGFNGRTLDAAARRGAGAVRRAAGGNAGRGGGRAGGPSGRAVPLQGQERIDFIRARYRKDAPGVVAKAEERLAALRTPADALRPFTEKLQERESNPVRRNVLGHLFGSKRVFNPSRAHDDALSMLRSILERQAGSAGLPRGVTARLSVHSVPYAARPLAAALQRMFGIDIVFVGGVSELPERLGFDGIYANDGKTVFVAADSTKPFHQVIGHEFLHWLRRSNPDLYKQFIRGIIPIIKPYSARDTARAKSAQYEGFGYDPAMVEDLGWEEVYADTFGDAWADPAFWRQFFAAVSPKLGQKIAAKLRLFFARIRMAVGLEAADPLMAKLYDDMAAVRGVIAEVMAEAAGRRQSHLDSSPDAVPAKSSRPSASPWYSELSRQVGGIAARAQPAAGWKAAIKGLVNKGLVKQAEVDWSGVDEWLDLATGPVSKEAVVGFLAENGVQLGEVKRGGGPFVEMAWVEQTDDGRWGLFGDGGKQLPGTYATQADAYDARDRLYASNKNRTRWSSWKIPGGDNYGEITLTNPMTDGARTPDPKDLEALKGARIKPYHDHDSGDFVGFETPDGLLVAEELADNLTDPNPEVIAAATRVEERLRKTAGYHSKHWPEKNVVAHIRFDTRTDADGRKVLFVNEIQSDWAQDGRELGFKGNRPYKVRQNAEGEWEVVQPNGAIEVFDTERSARRWAEGEERDGGVPAAPFVAGFRKAAVVPVTEEQTYTDRAGNEKKRNAVKGWHVQFGTGDDGKPRMVGYYPATEPGAEKQARDHAAQLDALREVQPDTEAWTSLAIKRVIRHAVENGYDRVAFATGPQISRALKMSHAIGRITHHSIGDGKWRLGLFGPTGEWRGAHEADARYLEQLVGREMAGRIMRGEGEPESGYTDDGWHMSDTLSWHETRAEAEAARLAEMKRGNWPEGSETKEWEGFGNGPTLSRLAVVQNGNGGWDVQEQTRTVGDTALRRQLTGVDLEMGGEGNGEFYGKIVPKVATEVLRKLGGDRPVLMKVPGADRAQIPFDAPEVVDTYQDPDTDETVYVVNVSEDVDYTVREYEIDRNADGTSKFSLRDPDGVAVGGWQTFKTLEDAMEAARQHREKAVNEAAGYTWGAPESDNVGFDITPALRERALGGLPMFARRPASAATWTAERIDALLKAYGYPMTAGKTKAFAAMMSPDDFLALTVPRDKQYMERLESELRPLDPARLAWEDQEIFLQLDRAPTVGGHGNNVTVVGHEGRHRMLALKKAGVKQVAVTLLPPIGVLSAKPVTKLMLDPQLFAPARNGKPEVRGAGRGVVMEAIPITYENRDLLITKFGDEQAAVRFSRRGDGPLARFGDAFRRWFGESKIVNADGTPRVMYHGSAADITRFKSKAEVKDDGHGNHGIYFTDDPGYASLYADGAGERMRDGAAVYPVYLRITNPLVITREPAFGQQPLLEQLRERVMPKLRRERERRRSTDYRYSSAYLSRADVAMLKEAGYDGIVNEALNEVVVFDPEQVKSATGNDGGFDPTNPDIRRSPRGDGAAPKGEGAPPLMRSPRGMAADAKQAVREARAAGTLAGYRGAFQRFFTRWTEVMGRLPDREYYLEHRQLAQGLIGAYEDIAKEIRQAFAGATAKDKGQLYHYLTTPDIRPEDVIDNVELRAAAAKTKKQINLVGDKLEEFGLLGEPAEDTVQGTLFPDKKKRRRFYDQYLPRLYLAHLLSESDWREIGAGKKPSDMGYRKPRGDLPEEVRRVILGEIRDPAYLAAMAVVRPMRDVALLEFMQSIARSDKLVLQRSLVEWRGKMVTPLWLRAEADRLREQALYMQDRRDALKASQLADEMDRVSIPALKALQAGDHTDWKKLPDSPRYGRLRGLHVRREVYDDLVGVYEMTPEDLKWYDPRSILGYGGVGTKVTQAWKTGKVALNPGSQVRNIVSNMVMLQLSGVPLHMVPVRVVQAIREVAEDGPHWKIAKKYGVTMASFASQEMVELKNDAIKLQLEWKDQHPIRKIGALAQLIARPVIGPATWFHQQMEVLGKTAKIIDVMESERAAHAKAEKAGKAKAPFDEDRAAVKAALEAQKWMYDYSLVSQPVRYLRNAPIGSPFLTWMVKTAPRLAEVAALHPQRLLPWVGMWYALPMLAAAALGGEADDWDELKQLMAEWMQKRSHMAAVPFRDAAGRVQLMDLGPFFPWTMYTDAVHNLLRGEPGAAISGLAGSVFSGGPIGSLMIAASTGVDPFTDRPIAPKGAPAGEQWGAWLSYLWTMAMPPVITEQGFAGKAHQAVTGTTNRYGDPRATAGQAAATLFGLNVYGINPDSTIGMELNRMSAEIMDTQILLTREMQDHALSPEQREKRIRVLSEEMQRRARKAGEYASRAEKLPSVMRPQPPGLKPVPVR